MKLHVFVHDEPVATLESTDGFRHVMTYHPDVAPDCFVSLLMPVRTESYAYPELHPLFRMNLLAMGRIKVAAPGADPTQAPLPFDVASLLRGDNSEEAFVDLVRRYAASGVSGVVPKFLSPDPLREHGKGTLATDRYIIKGTTSRLPGVALNEHLCMEVSRAAGMPTAATEVSDDGQALVVHRFDIEEDGGRRKGMEDLCSLLLLRPEQKYESTWERVVERIRIVVLDTEQRNDALSRLADLLLLTYALRNADCHTKNIALLYNSRNDIVLAPVYDMLTITVYDDYAKNPPGLPVNGRSTWMPGRSLERFLQTRCGLLPAQTLERVERICDAIVQVTPQVVSAVERYPAFREIGKRMLHAWNDGMNSLRLQKTWSLPSLDVAIRKARFSEPKPMAPTLNEKLGRSPLLGRR